MDSDTIELYFSDTTDLDVERCKECGSIDFEYTNTRVFCVRCGLVAKKSLYSTAGSATYCPVCSKESHLCQCPVIDCGSFAKYVIDEDGTDEEE